MTRRDFSKVRFQRVVSRLGSESVRGGDLLPGLPRQTQSKAELRAELETASCNAVLATKEITCSCGNRERRKVLASDLDRSFRCTQCERIRN